MKLSTKDELEQGFYVRRGYTEVLKLRGLELYAYAIIRAFTEGGEFKAYISNYHYISEFTGNAKSSVNKALHSLVEKALIIKTWVSTGNAMREAYVANIKHYNTLVESYVSKLQETMRGAGAQADETIPSTARNEREDAPSIPNTAGSARINSEPAPTEQNGERESVPTEQRGERESVPTEQKPANKSIPIEPKTAESARSVADAVRPMPRPAKSAQGAPDLPKINSTRQEEGRDSSYDPIAAEFKKLPRGSFRGCRVTAEQARHGFELAMRRSYGEDGGE